ncbi:unnamed protein product [Withania somnifera]
MKRGIQLCPRWFFCEDNVDIVNHLFLHCKTTGQLWRMFLNLKGISWRMPRKITETIQSWEEASVLAKNKDRWRIIPACIWWTIWKERNARCFESLDSSMLKIKLNYLLFLCFWCNQVYSNDSISIIDVLDSI